MIIFYLFLFYLLAVLTLPIIFGIIVHTAYFGFELLLIPVIILILIIVLKKDDKE